jgi:starch-binding outer membrane protein, SusD/RagB family
MTTSTRIPFATGRTATVGCAALAVALAACTGLLDVKNPNDVNISDLNNPASAFAIANGALSALAYGWGAILTENATVTDELTWTGSRDGFRELDVGTLTNRTNEFTDAAFPYVGRARWLTDFAIKRLATFDAAGTLKNRTDLARSYLYAAVAYTMIADNFNNFPIGSDMQNAAPPLGPAKMDSLYGVAIDYATKGIAIAQATGSVTWQTALTAARARAEYAKAIWALIHPPGPGVPYGSTPLVNDAAAVADAQAAITLADGFGTNWKFRFSYSPTTVDNYIGAWVNGRQEMRFGDRFVKRSAPKDTLRDPISTAVDPEIRRAVVEFVGTAATQSYGALTALSERELHLILAEAALAGGDTIGPTSGLAVHINYRRTLDNLPAYDPSNLGHPRPLAMLQYERQVNLFLQSRRLQDLYRFHISSDLWQSGRDAVAAPGTLFPITEVELLANPYCVQNPASC